MLTYYEMLEKNTKILNTYKVHSIWKFNAFTCFVALIISWGKDFWKSSVRAASSWCLGRQVFGYWYSSLRFLDLTYYVSSIGNWIVLGCAGFCPCEIWRCGCFEMICRIGASPGFHQNI